MRNILLIIFAVIALITIYVLLNFQLTIIAKNKDNDFILTNKGGLRDSCLKCVRKHVSQARALIDESKLGYPNHFYLALGHLGEAEAESIRDYPDFAKEIREAREGLYHGRDADLMSLLDHANAIEANIKKSKKSSQCLAKK